MSRTTLIIVLTVYAVMSLVTFAFYFADKHKASRRAWRIPESTLHWLAALGGWPGALLAVSLLRHKSSKHSFLIIIWAITAAHAAFWIWSALN